jgi:holliday junction DNA helicase RuvA
VISFLKGQLTALSLDKAELDVHGVGYEVAITAKHSLKLTIGQEVKITTKLIVREDDQLLFGFESSSDKELFDLLCSVSGIGPKLAMVTLSGMDAASLRNAVNNQDDAAFRAIPGVGPKTAKLIVISLAGKVGLSSVSSSNGNVLAALMQLGTDEAKARKVLAGLPAGLDDSSLLKAALAQLGAGKLVSGG